MEPNFEVKQKFRPFMDRNEGFKGWIVPGTLDNRPCPDAIGIWEKESTRPPINHMGIFNKLQEPDYSGTYSKKSFYMEDLDYMAEEWFMGLNPGWHNMGVVKSPKNTTLALALRHVVHGRLMGYPWIHVIAFAWRNRKKRVTRKNGSARL